MSSGQDEPSHPAAAAAAAADFCQLQVNIKGLINVVP
jgi:hypothetical protein